MDRLFMGALALLLPLAAPAAAQPAGECSAAASAWASPVRLGAARDMAGLDAAELQVGRAANLELHPGDALRLPVPAGREGGNGGLAAITIHTEGTYRVALGSAAWIDLVADGKPVPSTAHGHGAECSGIRKFVEFELKRGRYTVVLSGNAERRTMLLLAPRPKDAPALHP